MSEHFSHEEVACHCCDMDGTVPLLMEKLEELREAVGRPLALSCAYRCPRHNAEVGGVPNSQHVDGTAADVLVPEGMTVDELGDIAATIFDGVGRYYGSGFVHCDMRAGGDATNCYTWTD